MLAVLLTFIGVLIVLITEKVDKSALALIGATIAGLIIYVSPHNAVHNPSEIITTPYLLKHLPWDTVMFIFAMMMVVSMAGQTGLFQWLAVKTIQATKGKPRTLYFALIFFTFGMSFFFDTVSTMLIIAPLTIEIMEILRKDFRPYLIAEAVVANFGSIPSLIGSVPNIVIGEKANITFIQFLFVLGPVTVILLLVSLPLLWMLHKNEINGSTGDDDEIDTRIFFLEADRVIKDQKMFAISIIGIVILILGFTLGQILPGSELPFGIPNPLPPNPFPAVLTALTAMTFMLLAAGNKIKEMLRELQWSTIYFIVGLLFIVQAMEELGLIEIAIQILEPLITDNQEFGTIIMVAIGWFLSGVVDNIPISAALAPIAVGIGGEQSFLAMVLIFSVNVGGYVLPISSPANILAISFAEKRGSRISFAQFAKVGTTLAVIHVVIGIISFIILQPVLEPFLG